MSTIGYNSDTLDTDTDASSDGDDENQIAGTIDSNVIECMPTSQQKIDYNILTETELINGMNKTAQETSAIIRYSPSICRTLLHHFKWNSETLLEKYYESTDLALFFKNANLLNPDKGLIESNKPKLCVICYETKYLIGLQCGHLFCRDCWALYLGHKVEDEGRPFIACPEHKCEYILDDDITMKLLNNESTSHTYKRLVLNSYVECNKLLKWCPGTDCGRAVKVPHPEARAIQCLCGFTFCFQCIQQWHEPVNCKLLKLWLKKCSDDSETSNWLNANTKDCPKCQVTIEKDGGCNHMTCKNVSCRFEFCWTCLGAWAPHGSGWYSCNRFDDTAAQKARDEQGRSRASLQRYLHYYNRFGNHQNSLKLEYKLYALVAAKIEHMQQHNFSWIETQFLKKAVDVLNECRRTLMYTYVFAFYLNSSNLSEIFEGNQSDLELATEQLSEFLEKDLEAEENLVTLKQRVQDKYRYVEQRRAMLLKHCTEGYENNQWSFNENQDHLSQIGQGSKK